MENNHGDIYLYLSSFAILYFNSEFHEMFIPIFANFNEKSIKNLTKSMALIQVLQTIIILILGIFGYLTFGTNAEQNILQMYDPGQTFVAIGLFSYWLMSIAVCPICLAIMRNIIYAWLCEGIYSSI